MTAAIVDSNSSIMVAPLSSMINSFYLKFFSILFGTVAFCHPTNATETSLKCQWLLSQPKPNIFVTDWGPISYKIVGNILRLNIAVKTEHLRENFADTLSVLSLEKTETWKSQFHVRINSGKYFKMGSISNESLETDFVPGRINVEVILDHPSFLASAGEKNATELSFDVRDESGKWAIETYGLQLGPNASLRIEKLRTEPIESEYDQAVAEEVAIMDREFETAEQAKKRHIAAPTKTRASSNRYFEKISEREFQQKIDKALEKNDLLSELTADVKKDLSKVQFDIENIDDQQAYGHNRKMGRLIGLHTLKNGLTFLGVNAGGDWEAPIFFIIYWDGKKLRGYIPVEGNSWNTDTREAYGNDEEADLVNFKKRYPELAQKIKTEESAYFLQKIDFDPDKIEQDILTRIQAR